jgi:hypothetical protein
MEAHLKHLSLLMILSLFVGAAYANPRDLGRILGELKGHKTQGDMNSVYRLIGGHSNAPVEELPFLAPEIHVLRKSRNGAHVAASFRVEPMGQNQTVYLTIKNSYPMARKELRAEWQQSEFRIIDELIRNGILPSKQYLERAYSNNKLQESSVRFFNVNLLSEKKVQKLVEIMKGSESPASSF